MLLHVSVSLLILHMEHNTTTSCRLVIGCECKMWTRTILSNCFCQKDKNHLKVNMKTTAQHFYTRLLSGIQLCNEQLLAESLCHSRLRMKTKKCPKIFIFISQIDFSPNDSEHTEETWREYKLQISSKIIIRT